MLTCHGQEKEPSAGFKKKHPLKKKLLKAVTGRVACCADAAAAWRARTRRPPHRRRRHGGAAAGWGREGLREQAALGAVAWSSRRGWAAPWSAAARYCRRSWRGRAAFRQGDSAAKDGQRDLTPVGTPRHRDPSKGQDGWLHSSSQNGLSQNLEPNTTHISTGPLQTNKPAESFQ